MVATKIKPQRIDANNSPQVGYVPKYVDEQTFEWGAGGGGTGTGNQYLVKVSAMTGLTLVDIADSRITDTTGYVVFYATQPVGNVTRTLTNGHLTLVSDDAADTMYMKIVFLDIGPARQYMKGTAILNGTPGVVATILDPRFDNTTAGIVTPIDTPAGRVTATMSVGQMDISSTGTESNCDVNWFVFLDTINYSDGMPYSSTIHDDNMFFSKDSVTGFDTAHKASDLKSYMGTGYYPGIILSLPNVMQVFCDRLYGNCSTGYMTRGTPQYSDTENYAVLIEQNGRTPFIILKDGLGRTISTRTVPHATTNVASAFILNGFIFANFTDGTFEYCSVTADISVLGNWHTALISGYTLDINDICIGVSLGKLHVKRGGVTDIRTFSYDGAHTFTYVSTYTLTIASAVGIMINDKNYINCISGAGPRDGRPQSSTYLIGVYDLTQTLLYTDSNKMIDRIYKTKMYLSYFQSESSYCDAGGCGGLGGGFGATGLRWIHQIA